MLEREKSQNRKIGTQKTVLCQFAAHFCHVFRRFYTKVKSKESALKKLCVIGQITELKRSYRIVLLSSTCQV